MFEFPNPVNELAARTVAGVVLAASAIILTLSLTAGHGWLWLTVPLAYGFVARVLTGPTLSPVGTLASNVIAPRLGPPRPVPGPPKRFAQGIGAVVTITAVVAFLTGHAGTAQVLLALMIIAAGLESILGFCIGCKIFMFLMRRGWIPADACEACNSVGASSVGQLDQAAPISR